MIQEKPRSRKDLRGFSFFWRGLFFVRFPILSGFTRIVLSRILSRLFFLWVVPGNGRIEIFAE
jgi:hypothetical protein